jgi:hypothetical protein
MNLRTAMIVVSGLAALAVPTLAHAEAPSLYSNIKDANLPLPACMARAREVLTSNGFRNVSNGTWSTYGFFNDHTIVVRCVPEKGFVFIVVAGNVYEECERLTNLVQRQF